MVRQTGAPERGLVGGGIVLKLAPLRARLHAGESLAALAQAAGLPLATSALQPWSHWVTPFGVHKRFDTLFFVVIAPEGQLPSVDEGETTTLAWVHPPTALAEHRAANSTWSSPPCAPWSRCGRSPTAPPA